MDFQHEAYRPPIEDGRGIFPVTMRATALFLTLLDERLVVGLKNNQGDQL